MHFIFIKTFVFSFLHTKYDWFQSIDISFDCFLSALIRAKQIRIYLKKLFLSFEITTSLVSGASCSTFMHDTMKIVGYPRFFNCPRSISRGHKKLPH